MDSYSSPQMIPKKVPITGSLGPAKNQRVSAGSGTLPVVEDQHHAALELWPHSLPLGLGVLKKQGHQIWTQN